MVTPIDLDYRFAMSNAEFLAWIVGALIVGASVVLYFLERPKGSHHAS